MSHDNIVEFRHVKKSYFLGESEIEALKDVNFSVEKESFTL
jgi:ABC-type lipoprotein export system ATPase subunit